MNEGNKYTLEISISFDDQDNNLMQKIKQTKALLESTTNIKKAILKNQTKNVELDFLEYNAGYSLYNSAEQLFNTIRTKEICSRIKQKHKYKLLGVEKNEAPPDKKHDEEDKTYGNLFFGEMHTHIENFFKDNPDLQRSIEENTP